MHGRRAFPCRGRRERIRLLPAFQVRSLRFAAFLPCAAAFLREVCRVGKRFFVTTPNRWFPIEYHTGLPFLHFLPSAAYRAVLARTSYRYWADEARLNILSGDALRRMLPAGVKGQVETVRLFGLSSNLLAFGDSLGVGRDATLSSARSRR